MRGFKAAILLGGALLVGTSGAMAQSNTSYENWRQQVTTLKTGRTPAEQTASATYREEAGFRTAVAANDWFEQVFKIKTGRNTPAEAARQKVGTEFTNGSAPALPATWHGLLFSAKTGRPCPLQEEW